MDKEQLLARLQREAFNALAKTAKEQIQEDVITYMEGMQDPPFVFTDEDKQSVTDDICDIVVNNFNKLEE